MGLDTSHDCWSGPYSQFMRWRRWLAMQIGLPLELMEGFANWTYDERDVESLPLGDGKRDAITALARLGMPIQWLALSKEPLTTLLSHSDCDGKIPWWKCKAIALRLVRIYRDSKDDDVFGHGGMENRRGCYDSMRRATLRFAAGCRRAWLARENVEFH